MLLVHLDSFDDNEVYIQRENLEGRLEDRLFRPFDRRGLTEAMVADNLLPAGAGCIAMAHELLPGIEPLISALLRPPPSPRRRP